MSQNDTPADTAQRDEVRRRVFAEPDRDVWVVERNPGSGWRVSAVLGSYEDAERYKDDLREVMNSYPEDFPEDFKSKTEFRIRYNSRRSGTKYFENYPPEDDRPTTLTEEMLG